MIPTVAARASSLIGREGEIAALESVLADVSAGCGQVLVIEGEAGIGKSRLIEELLCRARESGFEVLAGCAVELERHRPFVTIIDALGSRGHDAAARRALAEISAVGAGGRTEEPGLAVQRVYSAIEHTLERVAAERRVVLVIDDAQWADPASLVSLAGLTRSNAHLPLLITVAARPSPRSAELASLLAGLTRRGGRRIALTSLDESQVHELVLAAFGRLPGPNLTQVLVRADGNPLLVLELLAAVGLHVADVAADRVDIRPAHAAEIPRTTVLHRIGRLSVAARETLRSASVLGSVFEVGELSMFTGRRAVDLLPPIEEARAAGVLVERGDKLAFGHDLVRDALYLDMPDSLRQALHRQYAEQLAEAGRAPLVCAEHLVRGATVGDLAAARTLRAAASSIVSQTPLVAVELIDHAARLAPVGSALRGELAADRAMALMAAGQAEAGERACRRALDLGLDRDRDALLRRMLIRSMMFSGRAAQTESLIEQSLALPGLSAGERAGFLGAASYLQLHRHDYVRAIELADRAVSAAREVEDEFALSEALNARAQALGYSGRVSDGARTAVDALRVLGTDRPPIGAQSVAGTAGLMLMAAGRLGEGASLLRHGVQLNDEAGAPSGVALQHVNLAEGLYLSGRWDDAIDEIDVSARLVDDGPALPASSRPLLALVAVRRGDQRTAREHLDAADAALRAGATSTRWHRRDLAAALLAELEGSAEAALARLERLWGMLASTGFGFAYPEVAPELARRLTAAGRRAEVEPLACVIEGCARQNPAVAAFTGAALLCRAAVTQDVDVALRAVATYRAGSRPIDLALACEDTAGLLVDAEREAEAVELLREALVILDSRHAVRDARRVTAALRELGVRQGVRAPRVAASSGWDALTTRERAVVDLLTARLSNREIAERLFLSRRTVETHVSHALAKTGLRSRIELGIEAGRRGFGPGRE